MQYVIGVTVYIGLQVYLRCANFDLRTVGYSYTAVPDL